MSEFIVTLLGLAELILFYELFFESKKVWSKKLLIYTIIYIAILGTVKFINPKTNNIILTMLGFVPFNLWISENTWKKLLLYIFSGIYCSIIFLPIELIITHFGSVGMGKNWLDLVVPIIDCLILGTALILRRKQNYKAMDIAFIRTWGLGLTSICGIIGMLVIAFIYVVSDDAMMDSKVKTIIVFGVVLLGVTFLLFGIIILFIGYLNAITLKEKQEKENLMLLMESYYEQIKSYDKEISKIKHDMKDHLESMRHLLEEEKIEASLTYVNDILGSVKSVEKIINLGNDFVSAIINSKKQVAHENNISFSATGYIPHEIKISNADICTIFANLLNNAIEACKNIRNAFIKVNVQMQGETLCIDITNSVNGDEINYRSTSKKDKRNHGFGIQNVKDVVYKYGGEMKINVEDQKFNVFIIFDDVLKG